MEKGTCKHFNGAYHTECCAAGVRYMDVTTQPDNPVGRALRLPCHSRPWPNASPSQMEHFNNRGKCEKYADPTAEEIAEHEAKWDRHYEKIKKSFAVVAKVKKEQKGRNWEGVEVCPACGGKLHMSHAACNGHVCGKCETEGCLAWME